MMIATRASLNSMNWADQVSVRIAHPAIMEKAYDALQACSTYLPWPLEAAGFIAWTQAGTFFPIFFRAGTAYGRVRIRLEETSPTTKILSVLRCRDRVGR